MEREISEILVEYGTYEQGLKDGGEILKKCGLMPRSRDGQ